MNARTPSDRAVRAPAGTGFRHPPGDLRRRARRWNRSAGLVGREVLALVVVTAGLLLVGYAWHLSVERKRRELVSFHNLQQWGIALNLSLIDNNHRLPVVGPREPDPSATTAWYNALPPYLAQRPLADLPPSERPRPGTRSLWVDPLSRKTEAPTDGRTYFGYGMNRYLLPAKPGTALRIHDLENPADTVFLAEVSGTDPGATPAQTVFRRGPRAPHPDARAYVLFCDGHVSMVTKGQLVDDPAVVDTAHPPATGLRWVPYRGSPEPDPYGPE